MADYVVTGRPVGRPLNPPCAEEFIDQWVHVGQTITVTLDAEDEAELKEVLAIEDAPS